MRRRVEPPRGAKAASRGGSQTVVLPGRNTRERPQATRVEQLEIENLHLKQLIGNLSLEKKLLLERLAAIEPTTSKE